MKKVIIALIAVFTCVTAFTVFAVGDSNVRGGKCNFSSECSHGICKDHKCGYCNFTSECKGYGICQNHECGYCNFSSECKGFGNCQNHQCTKSPW